MKFRVFFAFATGFLLPLKKASKKRTIYASVPLTLEDFIQSKDKQTK